MKQFSRPAQLWVGFAAAASIVSSVSDGWSGKPSPLTHQILLLIPALGFACTLFWMLGAPRPSDLGSSDQSSLSTHWPVVLLCFEFLSLVMIVAEARHFARFGYHLPLRSVCLAGVVILACWSTFLMRPGGWSLLCTVLGTYVVGSLLCIHDFPLNYLRSDMLPVIGWADTRLVHRLSPYATMHIGTRLYDFPYLPGMLVAFLPVVALGLDLRFATLVYLGAAAMLIFLSARPAFRKETAALLGLFLLCPFLQYRHDLYLQPHWFLVTLAVVLMNRRHFAWAGFAWGASCAVYQLSWVVFPFFLLNAYRRGGLSEAGRLTIVAVSGFLLLAGPFLPFAVRQVAQNTVGQWSHLSHALADPINLSYWLTYVVRPDQLKWVQAVVLSGLFLMAWVRGWCSTLVDTLRWMVVALALFIPLNVLVDGYFYLTLLLVLLLYVCVANDWWNTDPARDVQLAVTSAPVKGIAASA